MVAVAALAMFTAVGASAFIVRVRMGMAPCAVHRAEPQRGRVGPRLDVSRAFVAAVAERDDRAALELYRLLPDDADPTGHLLRLRETVMQRQMGLLEDELTRGDCDELRRHVAWLRQAAREDVSVHVGECRDARPRFISVELAP